MGTNRNNIAVFGAGNVGSATANALVLRNVGRKVLMFGRDTDKQIGEAMDINDTVPMISEMEVKASDNYEDLRDYGIIIVTIGARQNEGETRLELLGRNAKIIESVMKDLDRVAPDAIILMVSNPVDILTQVAINCSSRPEHLIFGSGTVLDTSRLRHQLGKAMEVDRKNIHVHVVGEHGDSEFPVWSSAFVGAVRMEDFPLPDGVNLEEVKNTCMDEVRNRAYHIIERKGYTNYGVAMAVAKICKSIVRNERKIFSVSVKAHETYGLGDDVTLSLPSVVGENGIERKLILTCNPQEQHLLREAGKRLSEAYTAIKPST